MGAIKLFFPLSFFSPRLLSGALQVMVDRKEIKWTIYCLLWGWAQAGSGRHDRSEEQDALLLLFSACVGPMEFFLKLFYVHKNVLLKFHFCLLEKKSVTKEQGNTSIVNDNIIIIPGKTAHIFVVLSLITLNNENRFMGV